MFAKPSVVLHIMAFLSCLFALAGCAGPGSGAGQGTTSRSASSPLVRPLNTGHFTSAGRYIPSADEKSQDCRRIRGKMGVRIVQLQRTGIVRDSSVLSRKFSGYFGSAKQGLDAAQARKRDRAILRAYNKLLADKGCRTVDLDKELAKRLFDPQAAQTGSKPQTR